ncbi:MAG: threonine--tRNA ligase [Tenericutes bacterium]|nr:threonine--tRNA ligase [Mycoplasmatota bacterium]
MINIKENERLSKLNHSCAHLLAQAVKHLYPEAKFWVGPVIEDGFYYDIDLGGKTLTEDDLPLIEKEMKKCSKDNKNIVRHEISKQEALEMFKDDPYKIDLISRMDENEQVISCYTQGDFTDLCRGPHVDNTKELKNFKLLKVSGAYWKNDAKNHMLQRIYGVCFDTPEELEAHLKELEEAKERDHRKIGKDLGIFMLSDLVGRGLPLWLPNGYTLWRTLQNYITDKEVKFGYKHVHTPDLGSVELYKTSGHWDHYKDDMFPAMKMDNEAYVLRPMNCPHHMVMFKNFLHSYKDMPVRIAEIANDFRYESAGSVKGIERARSFTQNDSHIFCTPEQIESEFKGVLDLIMDVYKDFGIEDFKCRLSLRDPQDKEKYFQDDNMWNNAESSLRKVLTELGVDYFEAVGEAAFYGPKLDILIKPAIGNEVALSTIQLDFLLPRRFDLYYINEKNEKETPVVIHRAILGSLDRFIAFLLEETKGVLPLWLAPVQVNIIPVNNEYHLDYANEVKKLLEENNIRVELDDRNEKLGYKMRESQKRKVPYTIILGNNERDDKTISYRIHGTEETNTLQQAEFISHINEMINNKVLAKDLK